MFPQGVREDFESLGREVVEVVEYFFNRSCSYVLCIACQGCELLGQEPLGAPLAEADGEDHTKVSENKHSREMHVDIDSLKQLIILQGFRRTRATATPKSECLAQTR